MVELAQHTHRVLKKLQERQAKHSMRAREIMCNPGNHNTGCTATCKLGHTMYSYKLLVFKNQRKLKLLQEQ